MAGSALGFSDDDVPDDVPDSLASDDLFAHELVHVKAVKPRRRKYLPGAVVCGRLRVQPATWRARRHRAHSTCAGAGRIGSPAAPPGSGLPPLRRAPPTLSPEASRESQLAKTARGGSLNGSQDGGEEVPMRRKLTQAQFVKSSERIRSLPCTFVKDASGNLDILDLK